jgi:hypothetical protein
MHALFGVGLVELDLQESRDRKIAGMQRHVQELKDDMRAASKQDRMESYYKSMQELQEYLSTMDAELSSMDGPVRGGE